MPTIPANYDQVNLIFDGAAAPAGAEVVFGVHNASALSPAAIGALISTNWNTNLKSKTNSLLTLETIRVKEGPAATGAFATVTVATAGTQVSTPVSPQVSMMLVKDTGLGGRSRRGRTFWPGLPEAHVDAGGLIGAADIAAYNTAFAAFLAQLATDSIPMVILHRDPLAGPTPVLLWQVQPKVATQRDRLRRR